MYAGVLLPVPYQCCTEGSQYNENVHQKKKTYDCVKNIDFIHVYVCEARNSTRPTCLRLESRYNISLFESNHFNYP